MIKFFFSGDNDEKIIYIFHVRVRANVAGFRGVYVRSNEFISVARCFRIM